MKRIAVIGAGIAGLSAAHYISLRHEVHVFEKASRLGGHTNTVTVAAENGLLYIDTGFIVHNERTYPNFCSLINSLGVATQPSDMSFAVTAQKGAFEYSSRGLKGFFAQKSNWYSPRHFKLLQEILRFNREAPKVLERQNSGEVTLEQFLEAGKYSPVFTERYLIPMASAVWSMAPDAMPGFPVLTLVRFMQNHGMLGINTHPRWRTIGGGSNSYIAPLTARYRKRLRTDANLTAVERFDRGVRLCFVDGSSQIFDQVVFACHGDQILPLLSQPTDAERRILSNFRTTRNEACLHTDASMLPTRHAARASWNYLLGDTRNVTLTYHMNRLQAFTANDEYCVSLNAQGAVASRKVVQRMVYEHPLYTQAAIRAQQEWAQISGHNRTHFCGAYWFYGFHEDGVRSGMRVAEAMGVTLT